MKHAGNELLIQAQQCELNIKSKSGRLLISQIAAPDWDDINALPYPYTCTKQVLAQNTSGDQMSRIKELEKQLDACPQYKALNQ